MELKVYEYKNCGTCKKACKFLDQKKIGYIKIPIRENPPTKAELRKMLKYLNGDVRKLFNTSGQDYRALKIKEKLPKLDLEEVLDLLSKNGNLIKRPFVLAGNAGWVGFKEEEWKKHILPGS